MAQQLMWIFVEELYRGQATDGTVVTVEAEAMELANKNAGRQVFDSDWWTETLTVVLERWGLFNRRWMDDTTRTPRMHFTKGEPRLTQPLPKMQSGPLSTRLLEKKKDEQ